MVFQVGGAYFVENGHHRVALARENGADFIDAQVTSLITDYEIGPDVDVCQVIHTEQQRLLLEESGLAAARPEASIQFTLLDGYTQLRDIINAYGYVLSPQRGTLLTPPEVAASWYDTVYRPGLEAVRRAGLPSLYESWHSTEADLFLWVYQLRRDLRAKDGRVDFARLPATLAQFTSVIAASATIYATAGSLCSGGATSAYLAAWAAVRSAVECRGRDRRPLRGTTAGDQDQEKRE